MNPSFINNPEYRDYISQSEKRSGTGPKIKNIVNENNTGRETIYFKYYDSVFKNSHLYPIEKTNFIKPYEQPQKLSSSKLLKSIQKTSSVPYKLMPIWQ